MPNIDCGAPPHIAIVIEDDDAVRFLMTRALRELQLVAVGLSSAEAALAWIELNGPPAFASIDLCLPRMSGFDLCRCLRTSPPTASLPILIVTARVDAADERAARALQARLLTKPLRLATYLAVARELIDDGAAAHARPAEHQSGAAAPSAATAAIAGARL